MRSHITVYTTITGDKDKLLENKLKSKSKAKWVAFTDRLYDSETWELRNSYDKFKDPRRNSRAPKILAHQFINSEYSIYHDGNCSILKTPEELIERFLGNHDMALFKHPKRDCIYGEATKCAIAKLDDPEVIIAQAVAYENAGYAKNKGLCECMLLIRRHTAKVEELNNYWWSEYTRHSVRDQISFMYAADKVGIRLNVIDLPWRLASNGLSGLRGDFFRIEPHIIMNPKV